MSTRAEADCPILFKEKKTPQERSADDAGGSPEPSNPRAKPKLKAKAARQARAKGKQSKARRRRSPASSSSGEDDEEEEAEQEGTPRRRVPQKRRVAARVSYKEESGSDEAAPDSDPEFSSEDAQPSRSQKQKTEVTSPSDSSTPHGSFAAPRGPISASTGPVSSRKGRKVPIAVKAAGLDQWLEVFCQREEKWLCVDCVHGVVDQPLTCYQYATKPLTYVVGIDSDGRVRDITQRYDPAWMTATRKCRVDAEWWAETLRPYQSPPVEREKKEDLEVRPCCLPFRDLSGIKFVLGFLVPLPPPTHTHTPFGAHPVRKSQLSPVSPCCHSRVLSALVTGQSESCTTWFDP